MAEWKKVIVSGSSAELTHVTASHGIQITNIADTSDNTENVLVVDASGNVKKATQATVAGAISQAHAYATTSIDNSSTFTGVGTVLSASVNSNITYVNTGNITLTVSGSTQGDFLGIKAVTKSIVAGDNITLTPSAASTTITAVTKSIVAGDNVTVALSGTSDTVATITAVTKSLIGGENVTVTLSGTNDTIATIKAATSSIVAPGANITVTPTVNSNGGTVYSISSTAFSPADSANFDNITATGNVSASGDNGVHTFGGTATFNTITASKLNIETLTELNTDTVVNGSLIFNGVELFEDRIVVRSGSTIFGSGSMPSEISHQFTGSVTITGSLTTGDNITAGTFTGDGSGLENVSATGLDIDGLSNSGTTIDQTDLLIYSDNGAEKKIQFSNLEDQIFSNIDAASTDVAVAAGGAITLANNSVGVAEISTAVAGVGLTGGGNSALKVDLSEVAEVPIDVANDYIAFIDTSATDNDTKKESVVDLAAFMAGNGIAAAGGVFKVDVSDFAGTGLKDDGSENLALDINGLSNESTVADGDYIAIYDVSDNLHKKTTIINALVDVLGTGFGIDGSVITLDPSTFGEGTVTLASLAEDAITIGSTTITLGTTETNLAGLEGLDLTAASHTIFATVGNNTLTMGTSDTTISVPGALTVAGNFTVQGTTTFINTETLTIDDNFIDLNANFGANGTNASDAPDQDAGISIKRGSAADANLFWDEGSGRWGLNLANISLTDTSETPSTFITSTQIETTNPGGSNFPTFGSTANARHGEMWVNRSTEEIWIYA
tara:strand:+ start:18230 stop:20581 length:2352 start_codon:yes stop_codon:yes gene_type:complete